MIVELDNNLSHYAEVIKKALHVDVKDVPGAGAAGGMGAALMAFLGAELKSGIEIVTRYRLVSQTWRRSTINR